MHLVPRAAQRRVRWQNGAGWTTEIFVDPPAGPFDLRLSVAEVDADCDFSRFPAVDRSLLVLDGAGFTLHVNGAPPVTLTADGPPHAFPGDRPARAVVPGPSRDFNVMTRRGRLAHTLARHALAGADALARPAGVGWAVYLHDGAATVAGAALGPGDCALFQPVPGDSPDIPLAGRAALVLTRWTLTTGPAARGTIG